MQNLDTNIGRNFIHETKWEQFKRSLTDSKAWCSHMTTDRSHKWSLVSACFSGKTLTLYTERSQPRGPQTAKLSCRKCPDGWTQRQTEGKWLLVDRKFPLSDSNVLNVSGGQSRKASACSALLLWHWGLKPSSHHARQAPLSYLQPQG